MSDMPRGSAPGVAALTHIAIRTRDFDASVDFYRRYAGFSVVHERTDAGIRVVWMSAQKDDPEFVLVLLSMPHEPASEPCPTDHYGFAVASPAEVDAIGALARAEHCLKFGPADGGPIVGYFVMVRDPSGNTCEFSHGQPIHPRQLKS